MVKKSKGKWPQPTFDQLTQDVNDIKTNLKVVTEMLTSLPNAGSTDGPARTIELLDRNTGNQSTHPSYSQIVSDNSRNRTLPQTTKLDDRTRLAVLTAMQTEKQSKKRRSCNLVVTGMPTSNIASDADQFVEFCFQEFNRQPVVRSTSRLGNPVPGKVQPLLICLESSEDANSFIDKTKVLRNSSHQFVRDNIYINRHMTRAEANAAFEIRRTKRLKGQTASNLPNNSTNSSTQPTISSPRSTSKPSQLDPEAHPFAASQSSSK